MINVRTAIEQHNRDGRSVEMEIGSARGELLCALADQNPDTLFIGVEIKSNEHHIASQRAHARRLNNVHFVHGEGLSILNMHFFPNELAAIHLYFPDPFPCQANNNEILLNKAFAATAFRVLKKGGVLRLLTDDSALFKRASTLFVGVNFWVATWIPISIHRTDDLLVGSPLEFKFIRSRKIHHASFVR